jgi:hypothetical protein
MCLLSQELDYDMRWLMVVLLGLGLFLTHSAEAASPTGRWSGTWTSQTNGHRGPLRARIRQVDSNTYRALFVGRFAKVVPFVYPAKLERVPGTCSQYTSSARLPLFGTYTMNASVSSGRFYATFRGRRDRGVFDMSR